MKLTAEELMNAGLWIEYCTKTDTNEYAVAEGLVGEDEYLDIPENWLAPNLLDKGEGAE